MQKLAILLLWLGYAASVQAQGLIGAPDESQREVATRLELERARIFHHGLKDLKNRTVYGSIVRELAETYELLNRWQDALAAQNSFDDLKLPPNAMAKCDECLFRPSDEVLAIDSGRLHNKVRAIEAVDHIRFDKQRRLPIPKWGPVQKQQYDLICRQVQLPGRYVTAVDKLLSKH